MVVDQRGLGDHRRPGDAGGLRPVASGGRGCRGSAADAVDRRHRSGSSPDRRRRPAADTDADAAARRRVARLDLRALDPGRRLRRIDARGRGARRGRPASRPTVRAPCSTSAAMPGWSLGEVARHDIEYIEWLDRASIGRNYRAELDAILRSTGRRKSAEGEADDRRGLYRRR